MGFRWGQNCHNISSMKKTLNGHFLFRLQYNCPVFPSNIQDWQRSCQRFFDIFYFVLRRRFVQSVLPWEITKYLIGGWTFWSKWNDVYAGIRTAQKGHLSMQAVSHCSRPNLLAVSLSSHAFITLRAQPKLWCHAGSIFHLFFWQ